MTGNCHVRCGAGEKFEIISKAYLSLFYAFRNATPDNLVLFNQRFPNLKDFDLQENFRSRTPIVDLANLLVTHTSKLKKTIIAHQKEQGIAPVIREISDPDEEASLFAKTVIKRIKNGDSLSSIAILARTKAELTHFHDTLEGYGIPCMIKVPEILGHTDFVKAVISFAHYAMDHNSLLDLALYAKAMGQDPFDLDALTSTDVGLQEQFSMLANEEDKINFFYELIRPLQTDYLANEFVEMIKGHGFHTLYEILDYCRKYRLYEPTDTRATANEDADAVSLITIHSAKGLEWPTVLLSVKKFRENTEEQRLLYVAITRAKKMLLVTHKPDQRLASLLTEDFLQKGA